MTRDEAIQSAYKICRACAGYDGYSNKELLDVTTTDIDLFIALGMLKLEEPKSAREKFKSNLISCGYNSSCLLEILVCFDESQK